MEKTVGDLEIKTTNEVDPYGWHVITINYNETQADNITIKGIDQLLDLEYIVKDAIRKINQGGRL